jgi:hypothetical protein
MVYELRGPAPTRRGPLPVGYTFAAPYGPVAQLGERAVRIREARGSSPLRSTTSGEYVGLALSPRRLIGPAPDGVELRVSWPFVKP